MRFAMSLNPSNGLKYLRHVLLSVLLFSTASAMPALSAPALVDFGFDAIYDNNISKTPDSMGSSASGTSTNAFVSARKVFLLSEDLSFMMKVGADYKAQHIDESADYVDVNALLATTFRPFENVSSPYFKMSLDARNKHYLNDFGNEQVYRAKFSINSQLTDKLKAELGVVRRIGESEWSPIDTLNIQSWDTDRTEYFLSMDLKIDPVTLYAKASVSEGDIIWTRQLAEGYLGIFGNNAKIQSLDLGINYPLSSSSALDFLATYREISRNGNDLYNPTSVSMAYIQRLSF